MNTDFSDRVAGYRQRLNDALDIALPASTAYPARLHEAMRYACEGGKRLRALLVYAAGETLAVRVEQLDAPATALELIHAYSLVHDDLPTMDDDDLRRGRPTCHRQYDEATAILVGDGLQTLAFELLTRAPGLSADTRLLMIEVLAQAAGSRGMVGGQAVDLESEQQALTLDQLEALHQHKTGALIRACLRLAALTRPDIGPAQQSALDTYGQALGLAYQIQDDVLDIEALSETLGKTAGKDMTAQKSTYPSLMGLEAAKARAAALFDEAREALTVFGEQGAALAWLADYIQNRRH